MRLAVLKHTMGKKYQPVCCRLPKFHDMIQIGIFGMHELAPPKKQILD